jgi:hypothetical protein
MALAFHSLASPEPYELLIIAPEAYGARLQSFIDFKQNQGIATRYVSVEAINESLRTSKPDLSLAEKIHIFVSREYESSGLKYLLLVGTYESIPAKYVYSPSEEFGIADFNYKPTDWYYAVPEWDDSKIGLLGGNVPEIAVGRLPVRDEEELEKVLSKIIWAEEHLQAGSFIIFGDFVKMESLLGIPYIFYESNGNLTDKIQKMTLFQGVFYAMSCSHGTPSSLWTRAKEGGWRAFLSYKDFEGIEGIYGIHYLLACFTGALDLEDGEGEVGGGGEGEADSLARSLIVSPKGPALVIASSRTESSDTTIPYNFWKTFFESGDVGQSFLIALKQYICDPAIFSMEKPRYQQYNFYLTKVIYGDVSWRVRDPKKTVVGLEARSPPVREPGQEPSLPKEIEGFALGMDSEKNAKAPKDQLIALSALLVSVSLPFCIVSVLFRHFLFLSWRDKKASIIQKFLRICGFQ